MNRIKPFAGAFSTQNLTDEDKPKNTLRGWIRHGRFFYYPPDGSEYAHVDHVEWVTASRMSDWRLTATIEYEPPYAGDHDYLLHLAVGPFRVFVGLNSSKAARDHRYETKGGPRIRGRKYGLDISGHGVYLKLGQDPEEWRREDPKWWEIRVHPKDIIFGKHSYSSEMISQSRVPVVMPEGVYIATCKLERARWVRPRLPFKSFVKEVVRADIEPDVPIPVPGKGENSYDQGDDAIYSLTTPAENAQDAAIQLSEDAMDTRRRYRNEGWRPDKGWPESSTGFSKFPEVEHE